MRCLRQGTLNVGNDAQNKANLLALAIAEANNVAADHVGPNAGWARWKAGFGPGYGVTPGGSTTSGAGLLLNVPKVPGFVPSVGTVDSEA